jgi:hypothetical protein
MQFKDFIASPDPGSSAPTLASSFGNAVFIYFRSLTRTMTFPDINFKISVIGALHALGFYKAEAEALKEANYDADDFSYEPIKAVYEYYRSLEIDPEKLAKIESFEPDGGDWCYVYLMNNWDGEDDQFLISSIEGIDQLKNLRSFEPISMITEDGLDYSPLLKCENLEAISSEFMRADEANENVIAQLEEKGVEIR